MSFAARLARALPRPTFSRTRLLTTTIPRHKDPWPLPHTPEHLASTATPTDVPPPEPLPRVGESSRKRGTLESDLLLSTFAKEQLKVMSEGELKEFDRLMDEPDWDIYYWATEKRTPPERWANSKLLDKLRVHVKNEGRVVRRMPDLS
ncbi:Flavinator of succinate dehydrogenase-domain-containing protein [Irpex lacteus]|nr:Flavinator of succinate dehydrogenase-domain-containing protein [Irpex lacteus]